jgi:hypothetical protein
MLKGYMIFSTLRNILYPIIDPRIASTIITGSITDITGINQNWIANSRRKNRSEPKRRVQIEWVAQ